MDLRPSLEPTLATLSEGTQSRRGATAALHLVDIHAKRLAQHLVVHVGRSDLHVVPVVHGHREASLRHAVVPHRG